MGELRYAAVRHETTATPCSRRGCGLHLAAGCALRVTGMRASSASPGMGSASRARARAPAALLGLHAGKRGKIESGGTHEIVKQAMKSCHETFHWKSVPFHIKVSRVENWVVKLGIETSLTVACVPPSCVPIRVPGRVEGPRGLLFFRPHPTSGENGSVCLIHLPRYWSTEVGLGFPATATTHINKGESSRSPARWKNLFI